MRRPTRPFASRLLFVVACAGAILAMHGVSVHLPPIAWASTPSHHHEPAAVSANETQVASAHQHQDTGQHCPSCGHETPAGLCAFIVTAAVMWRARRPNPVRFQLRGPNAPPVRLWSPDPPVPKPAFAIA